LFLIGICDGGMLIMRYFSMFFHILGFHNILQNE